MNMSVLAEKYRANGFLPIPLNPNMKTPLAKISLFKADRLPIGEKNNIGLFAGSKNHLVIIDADDERSRLNVSAKLEALGLLGWTTIVKTPKKNGLHFWLRVFDVPETAQTFYNLASNIGHGELRVRKPAYVVAPGSCIPEGRYEFVQGGIETFTTQPRVSWTSLLWLLPQESTLALSTDVLEYEKLKTIKYNASPPVLNLIKNINSPATDGRVQRINYTTGGTAQSWFNTRSEAELALVTGLVFAGWDFKQIKELFNMRRLGHYIETAQKDKYLTRTYNKAAAYVLSKLPA